MKTIKKGYLYELQNMKEPEAGQQIQFIEMKPKEPGGTELELVSDGTTNEEMLQVLIDRITFQNSKLPSRETSIAITKLQEAELWLEKRTKNRKEKGVEGTMKP